MRELATIEDELDLLEAIGPQANPKLPSFKVGGTGKKGSWDCDLTEFKARMPRSRGRLGGGLCRSGQRLRPSPGERHPCLHPGERAGPPERAGQLEFHDLLVLARALLRDPDHGPAVRATLHDRYDRLLLDEFQDTDPIQIELAVRIAAADPRSTAAGTARWDEVDVAPGHLFVVGDPKQSIYRFRRADIATFLRAAERFGAEGGGVVELTANFRTVEPIIDWVNHTFATLMGEGDDVARPAPLPTRVPSPGRRPAPRRAPARPSRFWDARSTPKAPWPTRCGRPRPARWRRRSPGSSTRGGTSATRTAGGARPGWATSPCWFRPAPPCPSWRRPSTRPASPSGPRPARWSTPAAPSATSSWCSGRSTTRPTTSTSSPPSVPRCWHVVTTTSSGSSGSGEDAGAISPTSPTRSRSTIPCGPPCCTCAPCTRSAPGWPLRSCWVGSRRTDGPSSSASPRAGPATCGGGCAS